MKNLKLGDKVNWRGGFGKDLPKVAKVTNIVVLNKTVESVAWGEVQSRAVVLDLDNDHWCYGNQVTQIR